ncbi:MAG: DUF6263 family protein [Ignavibacteria bacterium]|nr:DUF6263 family protein [Ignavibacteria bacterium]
MKNILTITIMLLSIVILSSCEKEKNENENESSKEITFSYDSTALKTTAVDKNEDQSFLFRYKFVTGETFKYRLTTIAQSEQSIVADTTMSENMSQTIIFILNFKTLSLDKDSVAELECTFTSINLKASAKGNELTYQSGVQMDSTERVNFAEYESYIDNPFNLRIGKLGEIIDIYKIDKIINKFLSIRGLSDSLNAQQKVMASQELTSRSIKPLVSQIFREVPESKMAVDSTWNQKRESMPVMVFQVDYENQYKVASLEMLGDEKLAVVTGSVKTNVLGDPNYTERGIKYNFDKPKSTATGKFYFNLNKGMVQKSRTESRMENGYSMEMPSPEGAKKASTKEIGTNVNVIELL